METKRAPSRAGAVLGKRSLSSWAVWKKGPVWKKRGAKGGVGTNLPHHRQSYQVALMDAGEASGFRRNLRGCLVLESAGATIRPALGRAPSIRAGRGKCPDPAPSAERSRGCVPCWAFYSESSACHGRQEFGSQDASLGELFGDPNPVGSGLGYGFFLVPVLRLDLLLMPPWNNFPSNN